VLGYADSALAESDRALKDAREIGHAATLMFGLTLTFWNHILCGNYAAASAQADEVVALADKTGILFWKIFGIMNQGCILALKGEASHAIQKITSGISAYRSTASTFWMPSNLSYLARAYATLSQFDDAWRSIDEAITVVQTTKEKLGGGGPPDWRRDRAEVACAGRAEGRGLFRARAFYRPRASKVLRAARGDEHGSALARSRQTTASPRPSRPVFGWFTEGFDTLDLKEAKALLDELR
jgi:hypothetical protein